MGGIRIMYKISYIITLIIIIILNITTVSFAAWQVNIEVSTPEPSSDTGVALNKLSIGTNTTATDGYDNQIDIIALLGGPIQAYFPHTEYSISQQKLWRDYRKDSLPKEWEIELTSSKADSPIKIIWKIDAPGNLKFSLLDKDSNQVINMITSSEYSYTSTTTAPKGFLLKVTENQSTKPVTNNPGANNAGGIKGGGCGYIKNSGGKDEKDYGQNALSIIILMIPLLLPLQHYVRQYRFAITRRKSSH